MALIVLRRGVNVGGHRTFHPSILARELSEYDVVNVGAAGTFIVRKPGSRGEFRAAMLRKLPFEAESYALQGSQSYAPGGGESVWNRVVPPRYRSIREHLVESRRPPPTTRNWNTILAVLGFLKDGGGKKATDSPRTT